MRQSLNHEKIKQKKLSDNTSRLILNTLLACLFFNLRRREYDFVICIRGQTLDPPLNVYKEIIFGSDTPFYKACPDELRKQQMIDQHVYDQKLMDDMIRKLAWKGLQKNIVMDGDGMMTVKRTGELLDAEVDLMYLKEKF